jgi:hypothetical protein
MGVAPKNLTMADIAWNEVDHDKRQMPSLGVYGGEPLTWSLSQEDHLPANVKFDKDNGGIYMEKTKDVTAAPEQTYTLTVQNPLGKAETKFKLKIDKKPTVPTV